MSKTDKEKSEIISNYIERAEDIRKNYRYCSRHPRIRLQYDRYNEVLWCPECSRPYPVEEDEKGNNALTEKEIKLIKRI